MNCKTIRGPGNPVTPLSIRTPGYAHSPADTCHSLKNGSFPRDGHIYCRCATCAYRRMTVKRFALSLLLAAAASLPTSLIAASAGAVRGKVLGPDNRPLAGVVVQLRNDLTGFRADAATAVDGSFSFNNVPYNPYELHIDVQGFQARHASIDVHSPVPVEQTIVLNVAGVSESIDVSAEPAAAQLETDNSQSHIDIDKSYIATAPAAVASRAMEQIVTSTPGFAKDENGRFHFQGAHSQSEYVIDGQTISDQTGVTFSNSIDPGIAQGIEIIYGNVPAEFGEKIGAVINLTTRSGLGSGAPKSEVFFGGSRFATFEAGASVAGGSQRFGYFGSVTGSRSDRFLDPVNFANLHNRGNTTRGFLRLDTQGPDSRDSLRFTLLLGQTRRDVPNTFLQEAAGQRERVRSEDQNVNLGWQRIVSSTSVLEIVGFGRFSKFQLEGTPQDTPVVVASDRTLNNYGIAPAYSWTNPHHEVKAGLNVKRYPIREHFSFGITDPALNDPAAPDSYNPSLAPYDLTRGGHTFDFNERRTGSYDAAYIQDNIKFGELTANVGIRYDRNSLPLKESAVQPRLGAAYFVAKTKTVLRASYNRVLYTPEYENILFASSPAAAALAPPAVHESQELGGGNLLVHSERQNAITVGVQQAIGSRLRLDADYWRRRSTFVGDQSQFVNTGIVFPLAFSKGNLDGWDLRLDLARTAGFRGFLSLGHTRAVYFPPLAGGLFLDAGAIDALTGGPFLIDHDQKLQAQGSLSYDFGSTGAWVATNVRYDSGLVTGADVASLLADPDNAFAAPYIVEHSGTGLDPNRVKPRTVVDLSLGANLTQYHLPVSIQADLLNATNKKGVYNVLSTFGGTHVIPPRMLAMRVRYTF
ncbi:MAG: TonB-dependent receptor [Acidobacteria bacterium]|nr:TonB-dependent receptor [Acidobacteriota bacterium]